MKKKQILFSIICTAFITAVLLVGCSSSGSNSGGTGDAAASASADSSSSASASASSSSSASSIPFTYNQPTPIPVTPDAASLKLYNLTGFASAATGGGVIAETSAAYAQVASAQDLVDALYSWYKGKAYTNTVTGKVWGGTSGVTVIEITADLNLGYTEVGTAVTASTSGASILSAHTAAKMHPTLLTTGVSLVAMKKSAGGLTIFSKNGATIKHATFNLKQTNNIIIRNLKFDELWEWDEASKGDYDKNDWDFIDLSNGAVAYNVWIDHCTFTKAYDGIVDMKAGTYNVTLSWCKYTGDDGATNSNSFVRQQFSDLETKYAAGNVTNVMYKFLRDNGFSYEDMVRVEQGHDKTHLIGATEKEADNSLFTITFHHDWFFNPWDRLPRLRGGQVHLYNIYVDDTLGYVAKQLRDTRVAAMTAANQLKMSSTYSFNPFLNGTISTESGAILVEKSVYWDCLTPLRNNQTDVADATYTGKILALDTVYKHTNTDSSVTSQRGDSTSSLLSALLGPVQAAIITFAWNTSSWNAVGGFPYTYYMHDPDTELLPALQNGCGAGKLSFTSAQWMSVAY